MSRVRVHNFSVSLDGFGTGEGQSLEAPFGHAGTTLHEWFFPTRTFQEMQGGPGEAPASTTPSPPATGRRGSVPEIMGGTSSSRSQRPVGTTKWGGWRGDDPRFLTPVFVLTHHSRRSIETAAGTTVPLHRRPVPQGV